MFDIVLIMNTDYLIPEGWGVMASFTSIHMDERYYEDPYLFNPWRWEVQYCYQLNKQQCIDS